MIRILTFMCLAISVFAFLQEKDTELTVGFRVRYDINPLENVIFNTAFMELPRSKASAVEKKWVEVPKPDSHKEFSSLVLLCPENKNCTTICLFFDDTGYVAGLLIAINVNQFTGSKYDWKTQGFTYWTVDNNGTSECYWTTAIYFSSSEYLLTSADTRIAARDDTKLLQDKYITVSGFNGQLHRISTNATELANSAKSNFTEQACMPAMGHHYYYNMSADLPCDANSLFPFFPLVYKNQVIGLGSTMFGKFTVKKGCTNYFEEPGKLAVKIIVPRGPQCLYDLADTPGIVTMHTYFIDNPTSIFCL